MNTPTSSTGRVAKTVATNPESPNSHERTVALDSSRVVVMGCLPLRAGMVAISCPDETKAESEVRTGSVKKRLPSPKGKS